MAITRTPMIDDDGSGTTGTIINNAWKTEFYNQIDPAATTSLMRVTSSGAITTSPAQVRVVYVQGSVTINSANVGNAGDLLIINNLTADTVVELPWGTGSGSFYNNVQSAPTRLGFLGSASYYAIGDGGPWFMMSHEQGAPIRAPFSAANFTASTGTWTVNASTLYLEYYLRGRQLQLALELTGSTISTDTAEIYINQAAYGGYFVNQQTYMGAVIAELPGNEVIRVYAGVAYGLDYRLGLNRLSGSLPTFGALGLHGSLIFHVR
jgi:hypothetical protein